MFVFHTEVLSPTLLHPPEPVEMSVTEQQELGYMPLRDDFEKVMAVITPLLSREPPRSRHPRDQREVSV